MKMGHERLDIFFSKLGVARDYLLNLKVIEGRDFNTGQQYYSWLSEKKLPAVKERILEAIEKDFLNGIIDDKCYSCLLEKHETLFKNYENALRKSYITEREWLLNSYV